MQGFCVIEAQIKVTRCCNVSYSYQQAAQI